MKVRFCAILAVLAAFTGASLAGERREEAEPRREAVHEKADRLAGAEADEPRWKRDIRAKLQRKVSFEFVDTPLEEAIAFLQTLTKINMILDPNALKGAGGARTAITLKVSDMTLELALKWILRLAELDYTIKNRAVFISKPDRLPGDLEIRIYDVRDLVADVQDHPAPEILPTGRLVEPKLKGDAILMPEAATGLTTGHLAEMMATRVKPDLWAAELGTAIEEREGRLVVRQTPDVHARVAAVLDTCRSSRSPQVRTECRFVAVAEALLARLRAQERPGRGLVYLKAPQLRLLEHAIRETEHARLVEAAEVTAYSAQRSHVMSGTSFEERTDDGGLDGTYFRGTVLDVRSTVSFDRRYVTMGLRITRVAKGADDGQPGFFRVRTTVTCLETDTVMITGATVPGKPDFRMVALVTPSILRLEPGAAAPLKSIVRPGAAAPPRPQPKAPARPNPPARAKRRGDAGAGVGAAKPEEKEVF